MAKSGVNADYWDDVKARDPYIFKKAEDFFRDLDNDSNGTKRPSIVSFNDNDQKLKDGSPNPVCGHGRIFRFNDDSLLLIEFMRPKVWRIRFDPHNKVGDDFTDYNTRTIIKDTLTHTIKTLDRIEGIKWHVELIKDAQYYVLQSVVKTQGKPSATVQLWIHRNPFQITAIRPVESIPPIHDLLETQDGDNPAHLTKLKTVAGVQPATVWKTQVNPLQYSTDATALSVAKSVTADFTGFGEHTGKHLFKKKGYLNYFNYDNMKYANVYGIGPLDDREPLYHSETYWIEVDGIPSCKSQVATFIDNYSQVCIDIGLSDSSTIRVATRFNSFAAIIVAGDSIGEIIQLYTSVIGRPRLKPRYALGYHQGGYGYDTKEMVLEVAEKYRQVDMQLDYRTFTMDTRPGHFPEPKDMFKRLREQGIKCCTNITPYISSITKPEFPDYKTYQDGLQKNYFLIDDRDIDPSAPEAWQVRYQEFGSGNSYTSNPTTQVPPYFEPDPYNFAEVYNSKKPFHGGVYYGWGNGHPGVYPNLNNKDVRKWWGKQYKDLFEAGLDFVWQDMTSPCIAEQYGDMKSLPFRLLLDSDGWSNDPRGSPKKKAIEIWHLYSYNLHKATYHGLNNLHKESDALKWRENRRNFIIGRGSFAGMHRFAGLWTGDNASTWDFLDISVVQVLAIGLSGITVSGADVGGFEFMDGQNWWADPELLMRWYCAYSLLPWFRNHYTKYRDWFDGPRKGEMRKDGKKFQEPYMYLEWPQQNPGVIAPGDQHTYDAVLPVCRYQVRLRYSLMQVLYDAMFENILNGLPIARAMIITDEQDRSLFSDDNRRFTCSQYLLRNDILIAPLLTPAPKSTREGEKVLREVYLPYPDSWYPMNLRPDEKLGAALNFKTKGGSHVMYDCKFSSQESQLPYVNPTYIREGAIIPKIEVRNYIPDPSLPELPPNPITIHVYPGKNKSYEMFLDDGISRDSAPDDSYLDSADGGPEIEISADRMGKSKFSKVVFEQKTTKTAYPDKDDIDVFRTLSIKCPHNGFQDGLAKTIGANYTIVFWHDPDVNLSTIVVTVGNGGSNQETDSNARATSVTVPVDTAHQGIDIKLKYTR